MSAVGWFLVDDRLIHGQVMVGWVLALDIPGIILANDRIATDAWRRDTLRTVVTSFSEGERSSFRFPILTQARSRLY
ncbi:PTS sugar transporter subunit IIB [candidate division WOR-3 bacterium]|nr:PTS sugar transporter subunit IIB [candidate division WOR-3 bacterium]